VFVLTAEDIRRSGATCIPEALQWVPGLTVLRLDGREDNAVSRRLVSTLLKMQGHKVTPVVNGLEAIAMFEQQPFDLVLMDVQMPEMDGFEATAEIRKREENTGNHMPIIALTAHAMKGDRERCLEAGRDGYLTKPIEDGDLLAVLDEFTPRCVANGTGE
jgi:CheY-like chemotaxis protein